MPYLVAPQYPKRRFLAKSSDKKKARYIAAKELEELVNSSDSSIRMPNEFDTNQFVEIEKDAFMPSSKKEVEKHVKTLAVSCYLKQESDRIREEFEQAYENINLLFESRSLTEEEFAKIKESLALIKKYAKYFLSYRDTLEQARESKNYLDKVLGFSECA